MSALLRQRVDLRIPIELPNGTLTSVIAYPMTNDDLALARMDPDGPLLALANCVRLHPEVAAEIDEADYATIVDVIASLNGKAAEIAQAKRPTLTLIKGGKQ